MYVGGVERGERNITLDNIQKIAVGLGVEAYDLFLYAAAGELREEQVTEAKMRKLLTKSDPRRKQLMWRLMREVGQWEET